MFNTRNNSNPKTGFTIIELLVVIAIIGLISSVVLVSMRGSTGKAKIAKGLEFSQTILNTIGHDAVGVWTFDEGSGGTANDKSGYGNHGTITGATFVDGEENTPHWFVNEGDGRSALSFDGNDYVNISSNMGNPDQMTIEFWFYGTSSDKNRVEYFMDARNGGNWWFLKSYNPTGTGNINFYNRVKVDPSDWTAGRWNHLVLVVQSVDSKIYINGNLKATGSGYNPNIGANLRIGTRHTTSSYFRGKFDEVRIYERALGSSEIQQHYAEGAEKHNLAINNQ